MTVPRSMMAVYGVNVVITLICWLTICFAMVRIRPECLLRLRLIIEAAEHPDGTEGP